MGLKNAKVILDFSCKDILQISKVNSSFNCFVVVWLVVRLLIFRRRCFICNCWVLSGRWEIKILKFQDLSLVLFHCILWYLTEKFASQDARLLSVDVFLRSWTRLLWVLMFFSYIICFAPLIPDSVLVDMLNRSGVLEPFLIVVIIFMLYILLLAYSALNAYQP